MNIADLREKRNKTMADAQAVQTAGDFTPESRARFDAMIADVDVIDADIKRAERLETEARTAQMQVANRPNPAVNEDRSVLEKRAFKDFLQYGTRPEQRDLLTINPNGAALIPQAFYGSIIEVQKAYGALYSVVDKIKTDTGAPMKVSVVDDTANLMVNVPEATQVPEADPNAYSIIVNSDELAGLVKVSLQELQDSAFNIDSFLRNSFGPRYFRTLTAAMALGSATGNIQGIVSGFAGNSYTTAAAGTVSYADFVKAYGALEPSYLANASWVINSNTRALLMGLVDNQGRPLLQDSATEGPFSSLFGCPIVIDQSLPNIGTGNAAILFGDFNAGYLLREVNPGLSVVRLNERFMDTLEVGFIANARVGGAVKLPKAVVSVVIK